MDGTRRRRTLFLLGALLLLVGGLVALAAVRSQGPSEGGTVRLRIEGPDGAPLHDSPIDVPSGANSVLDALVHAARRDGFAVETQDYPGMGAMVVQIFSHRNSGPCGWVYEVNGVGGTQSAEYERVADGDDIRWFWSCHG